MPYPKPGNIGRVSFYLILQDKEFGDPTEVRQAFHKKLLHIIIHMV